MDQHPASPVRDEMKRDWRGKTAVYEGSPNSVPPFSLKDKCISELEDQINDLYS